MINLTTFENNKFVIKKENKFKYIELLSESFDKFVADTEYTIQVIIPFHNSDLLEDVVSNIVNDQFIPQNVYIHVLIVCSGCSEKYINYAKKLESISTEIVKISVDVSPPGKACAVNKGISFFKSNLKHNPLVLIICDDVFLPKHAIFSLFFSLLQNDSYSACCLPSKPIYPEKNILLKKVQELYHDNFYKYENDYLVGRAYAFNINVINSLPENIISEDFYVQKVSEISSDGFLTLSGEFLTYYKPKSWADFLSLIKRYDFSYRQLKSIDTSNITKSKTEKLKDVIGQPKKPLMIALIKFFMVKGYTITTKLITLTIAIYHVFILPIEYKRFNKNTGYYKREETTTKVS